MEVNKDFKVRSMQVSDCSTVARMHKIELTDALLSQLGFRFLEKLYAYLLAEPTFRGFVLTHKDRVCGFITIALDASILYGVVYRKHSISLSIEVVLAGLKKPRLIWRAAQVMFSSRPVFDSELPRVELLSIAVDSCYRARGMGKRLLVSAIKAIQEAGNNALLVVVNEKIPANRFYQACGFVKRGSAVMHGVRMNFYVLDIGRS